MGDHADGRRAARLIEVQPSKNGLQISTMSSRIESQYASVAATSGSSPAIRGSGHADHCGARPSATGSITTRLFPKPAAEEQ